MAAWVRVEGVLDRPLHIAACYVPPGLPAAGLGQFFGHLCRDVLRAREAGYVAVGSDFNGRTTIFLFSFMSAHHALPSLVMLPSLQLVSSFGQGFCWLCMHRPHEDVVGLEWCMGMPPLFTS